MVKAFNTLWSEYLRRERRPAGVEQRVLLMAGDDQRGKSLVGGLIADIGFAALDTGSLRAGGHFQQPGSPLYNELLTAPEARERLLQATP